MKNAVMLVNTLPRLDYWNVTKEPVLGIPMGLLSIGSVLHENGYPVKIVDPVVDKDYLDIIGANLNDCLYVGISAMTAGVASGLEISEYIRKISDGTEGISAHLFFFLSRLLPDISEHLFSFFRLFGIILFYSLYILYLSIIFL